MLQEMSPNTKKLVHFAEQPATVVGTGAGPSDSEDSDEYYERMESPPPPTLSPQANTALLGYKQLMMGNEAPIVSYVYVCKCLLKVTSVVNVTNAFTYIM